MPIAADELARMAPFGGGPGVCARRDSSNESASRSVAAGPSLDKTARTFLMLPASLRTAITNDDPSIICILMVPSSKACKKASHRSPPASPP
eukprot:scaffold30612_cov30-Tisochrysis_lutea.AAC.1